MEVEHPHIYLYAKYWYQQNDLISDLKKLISHECAIEEKYIQDIDVVHEMIHLAVLSIDKYYSDNHNKNYEIERLLFGTVEGVVLGNGFTPKNQYECICYSCLQTIRYSIVPNLPEPDYSLLPKNLHN